MSKSIQLSDQKAIQSCRIPSEKEVHLLAIASGTTGRFMRALYIQGLFQGRLATSPDKPIYVLSYMPHHAPTSGQIALKVERGVIVDVTAPSIKHWGKEANRDNLFAYSLLAKPYSLMRTQSDEVVFEAEGIETWSEWVVKNKMGAPIEATNR